MTNTATTPTDDPAGREASDAQAAGAEDTKSNMADASLTRTWGLTVSLFLIGVLFAATAISGYWAFWQLQQAGQERLAFAKQLSQQKQQHQRQNDAMALAQQQLLKEWQQQLQRQDTLEAHLRHQQQALATLEQQSHEPGRALMRQWRMETARTLLSSVGTQLEIHHDTAAARRLLSGALSMLETLPNPHLSGVRDAIVVEQSALRTMRAPDLRRYRYQLGEHIATVDSLPLRASTPTAKTRPLVGEGGFAPLLGRLGPVGDLLDGIAQQLGSLVEVRTVKDKDPATGEATEDTPRRARERLRLYLSQLQLALSLRDAQAVRGNAKQSANWLTVHFHPDGEQVAQMRPLLKQLGELQITPPPFVEPPSLRALEQLITAAYPEQTNLGTSETAKP